jgi:hypothetical protein
MPDYFCHHWSCSRASAAQRCTYSGQQEGLAVLQAVFHGVSIASGLTPGARPTRERVSTESAVRTNTRAKATQAWHAAGIEIGRRWASDGADAAQLARVADLEDAKLVELHDSSGWLAVVWRAIHGSNCPLPSPVPETLVRLFGNEYIRVSQLRGFVDGAREVHALREA